MKCFGWAAWVLSVVTAIWVVPDEAARVMTTAWSVAVVVVTAVFVGGYLSLSKSTDVPERATGVRSWLLVLEALILLVFVRTAAVYALLPARVLTPDLVASYRGSSVVFAAVFFVELWLVILWVRLQVAARRARREAAEDQADYRNGWPPRA